MSHKLKPAYTHTYVHTHVRAYIHTYVRTYIHTYIHTYIRTYIHTYIHMRSHRVPHTHLPLLPSFGRPLLSLPLLPELNLSQRLPPQPQLMLVLPISMAVTEAKGQLHSTKTGLHRAQPIQVHKMNVYVTEWGLLFNMQSSHSCTPHPILYNMYKICNNNVYNM